MYSRKRVIGAAAFLLVVAVSGAGIYQRIHGHAENQEAAAGGGGSADPASVEAGAAFDADVPIPVAAARVVRDTLVLSVTAAAQAASFRSVVLKARVEGHVRAVHVRENATVGGGQLLIEIDSQEYDLAMREKRASYAQAEASYRELLVGDERITDAALRAERERNARVKAGLEGSAVAVERAELDLANTRIRAPFAGRIANLKVVPGQYISAGEEVLTVQQMDPLRVETQVLQTEVGLIAPGSRATLAFTAFSGETFTGTVETVNPVVEDRTRTARVTVSVRNPQNRLLPGMDARVALAAQRLPNRLLVPRAAIRERDNRTMLFVFEGEGDTGRAKWRYVTTGLQNDTLVEVLENPETELVEPGELVLVEGHHTLVHDALVRLAEDIKAEGGRPQ